MAPGKRGTGAAHTNTGNLGSRKAASVIVITTLTHSAGKILGGTAAHVHCVVAPHDLAIRVGRGAGAIVQHAAQLGRPARRATVEHVSHPGATLLHHIEDTQGGGSRVDACVQCRQ